jgi:hypothetical protein
MFRFLIAAAALGATLATAGVALAQGYAPGPYNNPGPYYPPYATVPVAPMPPVYYQPAPVYSDPHTGGGASRAYSYWGAQKSN